MSQYPHERIGWGGALWIATAAVLAFGAAIGGDFVFDDLHSVRDNAALRSLANIPAFFVDVDLFSALECRLYRPVLLTTFALDAAVGGMAAWPFKLTNLLLHILAAVSVTSIARCLGADRARAILGGCLFAAHPLLSEAVNTVSGRSNILMVLGLLLAMRYHLWALAGQRWATLGTLGFGVVSLGSKEPGMILPVLLLILEFLHRGRHARDPGVSGLQFWGGIAARILPVVALVVGYVMLRAHLLGAASFAVNSWQGTGVDSGFTRGMHTQLASMALVLPDTLRMMVLPFGMTMDPVVPYEASLAWPSVWLAAGLLLGLTVWGLRAPFRHPVRFLGVCLAWGCAMPWVLKPLNHPYLEHRLYGVVAGLILVAVAALPRLEPGILRRRVFSPAVAATFRLACISADRSLDFLSQERLWSSELARNPDSKVAAAGMSVCLIETGRFGEAKPHLERLVAAYPHRRDARMNLAEAELQLGAAGDPASAVAHARYLTTHWPRNPFYRLLLSRALAS